MWWNTLLLSLREIRRNLMRSFLTVLGIVIGVAAVITMVTLGNGATRAVSDQISSLGSNLLMIRPGQRLGPTSDSADGSFSRLCIACTSGGIIRSDHSPAPSSLQRRARRRRQGSVVDDFDRQRAGVGAGSLA